MALWPLVLYALLAIGLAAAMVGLSYFLGERHRESATDQQYESGIAATGPPRVRLSAHFYLVAIFFVIFDLEVVFFLAWGVAARALGWAGYVGILVFALILVAGLVYEWRAGALDWAGRPRPMREPDGGRLP